MSKSNSLIHVIIPAYNEEKKVEQVISGLNQLNLDLKIWVIDDGSKDDTAEKAMEEITSEAINFMIANKGYGEIKK